MTCCKKLVAYHIFHDGISYDSRPNGVLVTFADGSSRLVLNIRLTEENLQKIYYAACGLCRGEMEAVR